ncbi:hypothetical protein [Dyella japonica]|uniref:Uncharacterized protein n=1 Tax=Dyella japonica A8 TaxID=1217721 RepID=A0A075JXT9_9GAMM|nr:hypothetical protein [Dyella japonica]AIF46292.1 hypothetical protein HY57_02995 [Dyella japonica A8]
MRVFRGLLWALAALLATLVAAFAWGRLRPPTPEQKTALATLQVDHKPTQGRNAYPALWLVGFDVPPAQLDAAYAKDRQRIEAWQQSLDASGHAPPMPRPGAGFAPLPQLSTDERKALCGIRDPDCLGKARTHNDALHALIAKHAKLLAHDKALAGFDYAWHDTPRDPLGLMPPYGPAMGLWQTDIALDFVDGHQAQALDGACTQVATLRRLHAHSNTMVGTLVLAARLRGSVLLFAQILSEVPADMPLPASCAVAFAPLAVSDIDLCPGTQSEFAWLASSALPDAGERWYERWRLSGPLTQRLLAPTYAAVCDAAVQKALLADEVVSLKRPPPSFDIFDTIANRGGVALSRQPVVDFGGWLAIQQDTAATLRMGALLIWLRENHGGHPSWPQQLAARPAWMRFGEDRAVSVTPDGHALTMKLRSNARHEWPTSWPLPTSP